MRPDRRAALLVLLLASTQVAWLDPHARAREGNRLYAAGKFDDAAAKYNEALVDDPDSSRLHFNLGDAQYRQGKFAEALKAFQQIPTTDDDKARTSRVAYNAGNALYKLGAAAEGGKPQEALQHWGEAVAAYRRALGADPENVDAKFNHEFVMKKIADLRKKLQEQQKQDEQKKQEQQQQNQDQQQQQQKDQQQDQQQAQDKPQDQPQDGEKKPDEQQQQAEQPKPNQQQPEQQPEQQQAAQEQKPDGQQGAAAAAGEKKPGEMSQQEATALLDGEKSDEVRPDEVVKKLMRGGEFQPAQDW